MDCGRPVRESDPAPAVVRLPRGLMVLMGALAALGPFSIDLYLPAFGAIAGELRARPDQVQATLSTYFAGLAAGQLLVGPLSDRIGRRGPLLAGLALYVLASLACALAPDVEALAGWRAVQAFGACAGLVTSRAVLRDLFSPRDMARALSAVMLVMGLAPIVAPMVGATVSEVLGWRALFVGLAAYGAVVLVAVAASLPETRGEAPGRSAAQVVGAFVEVLRTRHFTGHAVAGSLAMAAMFAYIASSSFVFTQAYGLSTGGFALVFGGTAASFIAATQVNERWLRRRSPESTLPAVLGVQAVASLGVLLAATTGLGGWVGLSIPLVVCIASLGFSLPNTTAAAMAPVGHHAGIAAALLGVIQYGVAGLATWAVGGLYDGTALPMATAIAVLSVSASVVLFASTGDRTRVAPELARSR
ncbi:MAG: multidrug effflux MFS transporter [Alphaproteobacteria bacterium]|nr:multidrug effflux MFS transporter [Alphaproteobacteria bacterium]